MLIRLVHDREVQLYDGTRLIKHDSYDHLLSNGQTTEKMAKNGIFRIHPSFRIVALAEPPSGEFDDLKTKFRCNQNKNNFYFEKRNKFYKKKRNDSNENNFYSGNRKKLAVSRGAELISVSRSSKFKQRRGKTYYSINGMRYFFTMIQLFSIVGFE